MIGISCALLILVGAIIFNFIKAENKDQKTAEVASKSDRIVINSPADKMSDAELKKHSNIIITGRVTQLKEKSSISAKASANNQSFTVETPAAIYDLDVIEEISNSGKAAPKKSA